MKTTIINRDTLNISGITLPLIPFNCIFDTDFGLLKLVYKEYLDPSVFNIDWFKDNNKICNMVLSLYTRKHNNPLMLCLNDIDNKEEFANDMYVEFIKEKYNEIVYNSVATEFLNLIKLYTISDIKPTILYSNSIELEYMNNFKELKNINKISFIDLLESGSDIYEQFFFKYVYNDIYLKTLVDSLKIKTVYFAKYHFNYDEELLIDGSYLTKILENKNKILLIDLYDLSKLGGYNNEQ